MLLATTALSLIGGWAAVLAVPDDNRLGRVCSRWRLQSRGCPEVDL